jgi:hypothetical protein
VLLLLLASTKVLASLGESSPANKAAVDEALEQAGGRMELHGPGGSWGQCVVPTEHIMAMLGVLEGPPEGPALLEPKCLSSSC